MGAGETYYKSFHPGAIPQTIKTGRDTLKQQCDRAPPAEGARSHRRAKPTPRGVGWVIYLFNLH